MIVALAIVWGLAGYAALGIVFSVAFLTRGVGRIDPAAGAGGWGFRLIIAPGVVALWPVLLRRVLAGGAVKPPHSSAGSGGHA